VVAVAVERLPIIHNLEQEELQFQQLLIQLLLELVVLVILEMELKEQIVQVYL